RAEVTRPASSREQPYPDQDVEVRAGDSADQVGEHESPTADRVALLVQQGVEVVHRGIAHERDREEDREADPTGPPDERLHGLQDLRAPRMAAHPTLDEWVHFVPDVEDGDGTDGFPEAEHDRLDRGVNLRVEREQRFDRNRQDEGGGDGIDEKAGEVAEGARRIQAKLERGESQDADAGPSLPGANGFLSLKTSARPRELREGNASPPSEGEQVRPRGLREPAGLDQREGLVPEPSDCLAHCAIAANLDERTPAGPEDVTMEVEERARGGAGVPDRHLARLLFVSDIDGVPDFPEILVRLDERPARRLAELRRSRVSRPFHEPAQEPGRIVQGSQRPPAAKGGVQVPPGARDLGPRLLRRLLQDRDQDAVSYEVTDRRPFAADD